MIVRILPGAEAELEAIGDYIVRDNPPRALIFVCELHDKCMSLADKGLTDPLVPRYEDRGVGTVFTAATKSSIASPASPSALT